ncbi:MAG: STAS domain-containing protein [Acetatifactor sp.]|jgi:anti-anti-sigma factor|nr:STAS domain-containing protein [Acetatifactor sp.]
MTVKLMKQGEDAVLFLEGRIDTVTAPEAQEALLPMVDEFGKLTLDFDKVSFVSSAGLRVLLMLQKKCNAQGKEMKLVHVKSSIMEVFDMTGFSGMLNIEN